MKRQGFTLIELLAVILILGIIALIAIPTVTNIIEEARMGAFKATVNEIANVAEQNCQLEGIKNLTPTTKINFENGNPSINLDYKGTSPDSGFINLSNDCASTFKLADSRYCAVKDSSDGDILITKVSEGNCEVTVVEYTPEDCFEFDSSTGTITKYLCGRKYDGNNYDTRTYTTLEKYYPDVVIPLTIGGVKVEQIAREAFSAGKVLIDDIYQYDYRGITSVALNTNIKKIYYNAFAYNDIEYLKIPSSVELFDRWLDSSKYVVIDAKEGLPNPVTYDNYGTLVYARTSCSICSDTEPRYEILLPTRSTELEAEFDDWAVPYTVEQKTGYVRYVASYTCAIC